MEEARKIAQRKKLNMKLYPTYRMLATNILFYNAIKVLFLTQVKGISNANVVLLETLYSFFKMIIQIPITVVVAKLGKRKSVILGNIFLALELIIIIVSKNFVHLILSQVISSIAWSCKSIAEAPLLEDSIPETTKKSKIFTKLDSKGYSKFCYISAIATIASGFLYEINPYIPIVLALSFIIIGIIISLNFIEIEKENNKENKTVKQSISEVKEGFIFIFKSPRLKSLLIMVGFIWGIICLFSTYQTTLLKDLQVSAKYIGIIIAILEIIEGKASTKANNFNEKHKNKSLTYIAIRMTLGIAIAGGVVVIGVYKIPGLAIILFTYILRANDRGIFQIIKKRYMGNFMTPEILTKIYSVHSVMCSIFRMIIAAVGSYLLTIMTIDRAMVVVGILFTIVTLIFSRYMKTRIGLKPEEYTKKDVVWI